MEALVICLALSGVIGLLSTFILIVEESFKKLSISGWMLYILLGFVGIITFLIITLLSSIVCHILDILLFKKEYR